MRRSRLQIFSCVSSHLAKYGKKRLILFLCCAFALIFLLRWKFVCTNVQPLIHVQKLCSSYKKGQSVGNLCADVCHPISPSTVSCHNFYQEKAAIFTGIVGNTSVVFKMAKMTPETNQLYWLDGAKRKIYPSQDEFSDMVQGVVKQKFNIAVNDMDASRLSYIPYNVGKMLNRYTEMENVWALIQDNEYLALILYEKFGIFPDLIGTCGSMYAVRQLATISGYWHLMTLYDSEEEWLKRVKLSIMILDFLSRLETGLPEPLLICNVKMSNFGVTSDLKTILYLDLESVHPISIANRITGDGSRCKKHSDCDYLNCRSFCNLISKRCEHGVANNNLQMVCERIFLGWVMSGRMMVPGLLMGPRTPHVLVELLELCANPATESGTPRASATKEVRKRLYDLLLHLTF
ncbi:protein-kinase domain of FAM69 domain-containing protein [Phthorimaea operculella]|nr:protein-kinase domain of FAM69 domain-containing protein [Phthorimaea operculella]